MNQVYLKRSKILPLYGTSITKVALLHICRIRINEENGSCDLCYSFCAAQISNLDFLNLVSFDNIIISCICKYDITIFSTSDINDVVKNDFSNISNNLCFICLQR